MDIITLSRFLQCTGLFPAEFMETCGLGRTRVKLQGSEKYSIISLIQLIMLTLIYMDFLHFEEDGRLVLIRCMEVGWITVGLVLSLVQLKKIAVCLSRASHVLDSVSDNSSMTGCYHLILGNISYQATNCLLYLVVFASITPFELLTLFADFTTVLMPMMLNCCIITLLQTMKISYSDINRKISAVAEESTMLEMFSPDELTVLAQRHWDTGTLMQHVNDTFGLYVVILCAYTLGKLAFLLYFTFPYNSFQQVDIRGLFPYITIYSTMYLLVIMLIISTKAGEAVAERKKTLALLYRLLRRKSENMKNQALQQVHVFQVQLKARDVHLSASGLFNVNRTILFELVTQIISYFIVLVQFKVFQTGPG